jgi:hypothetical protein
VASNAFSKCPGCGLDNPQGAPRCLCGVDLSAPAAAVSAPHQLSSWIKVLPILIALGFMGRSFVQMNKVTSAISSNATQPVQCVETYGITLANSEYYHAEGNWDMAPQRTPQLATVVSGMARNDCGEPLNSVVVSIKVQDDDGRRGSGSAMISNLGVGEAKRFEKAWMGRVTSYEIAGIRK